jgi:hypothetical protein
LKSNFLDSSDGGHNTPGENFYYGGSEITSTSGIPLNTILNGQKWNNFKNNKNFNDPIHINHFPSIS